MNQHKIETIAPGEFEEHPQHKESFFEASAKAKKGTYYQSISLYGKIKPVVYIEANGKKLVIDGWGYVQFALENGITEVNARKVDVTGDTDINRLMLELQFSDHSSPQEEYNIYKVAFLIHNKGKGFRSDLEDTAKEKAENNQVNPTKEEMAARKEQEKNEKKRRETIYDKIAAMTSAPSSKRVQYMLSIGNTNPLYFERMEKDRMSLHVAYLECKKDRDGEMPEPPRVKSPVFIQTMTAVPQHGTPTRTDELTDSQNGTYENEGGPAEEDDQKTECNEDNTSDYYETQPANGEQYFRITGICEQSGEQVTITITKNEIEKQCREQS